MKYLLFLIVSLIGISPTFGQQTFAEASVYFDTDKHHLTTASESALSKFIASLKETNDDYEIKIEAHTDGRASQAYNTALSQRRAKSVESYLKDNDINTYNISIAIFGEDNPSFSNKHENGMSKNRRVDIKAILTKTEISELETFLSTESQKRTQIFKINNDEKNLIVGNSGTKVYIEPNTFVFENGEIPALNEVQIKMKEAYTLEDMMVFQLSTNSDGKILETGGMVFLQATSQGQNLKIQDGKSITIGLPADRLKDDMQLFDGVSVGNDIQWKATNQGFAEVPFEANFPNASDLPSSKFSYQVKRNADGTPMLDEAQHQYYKSRIPDLLLYVSLVPPQRPQKPYEPQKPELERIIYKKNSLKSIFISKKKIEKKVVERYNRRMKVYNRKMEKYNEDLKWYDRELKSYIADSTIFFPEWLAYQKLRMDIVTGKLMKEFDESFEITGNISNQKMQNYFFTNNQLGWINCDRFYNTPRNKKMILTINDNDDEDELVYIILDGFYSCLEVNRQDKNTYTSQLIPKSTKITIVALKVKNGKNYIAKHKIRAKEGVNYDLVYEQVNSAQKLTDLLKL